MKTPVRKTPLVLGVSLVVCAVIALLKSNHSSTERNEGVGQTAGGMSVNIASADATPGKSEAEPGSEAPRSTKGAERPSEEVLAKQRRERHRLELVDALDKLKKGGFGERHPNVVKATEELREIEAEQAVAGDRPKK